MLRRELCAGETALSAVILVDAGDDALLARQRTALDEARAEPRPALRHAHEGDRAVAGSGDDTRGAGWAGRGRGGGRGL